MSYDPLSAVTDEPLMIDANVVRRLIAFRNNAKFEDLPGENTTAERERLLNVIDALTDALIQGVEANATKLWVMAQFEAHLIKVQSEDTVARDHMGTEVEEIMDILNIESSDGILSYCLGGI